MYAFATPKFLAYLVVLCLTSGVPINNTVARLWSNILPPHQILAPNKNFGLATLLCIPTLRFSYIHISVQFHSYFGSVSFILAL